MAAAESACGPRNTNFTVSVDESTHPTPTPENGKAMIYVVHETAGTTRVGLDGKWLGALKDQAYFFAPIEPGEHHFCAIGHQGFYTGHIVLHELQARAGMTYYFVVRFVGGQLSNEYSASQVDSDEGKYLVASTPFSTSRPK